MSARRLPCHAMARAALLAGAAIVAAAASGGSGATAQGPLVEVTRTPEIVRTGEVLEVAVAVRSTSAARTVRLTFDAPELAPGRREPIGSPLREVGVRTEGPGEVSLARTIPDFPQDACVQGSTGFATSATVELPPGGDTTVRLRYRVGRVPVGEGLRVVVAATADDGLRQTVRSTAVRVRGRRLPTLRLRTTPGTAGRYRFFRRPPALTVRGFASRALRGRRVTVAHASAVLANELYDRPRSRHRVLGRPRVAPDGTFRLPTWRPARGAAHQLIAWTGPAPKLHAQEACPVRFGVAARPVRAE